LLEGGVRGEGSRVRVVAQLIRVAYQQRDVALLCVRDSQNRVFASVKDTPEFQALLQDLHYPQ
jgi:TolB-like protein